MTDLKVFEKYGYIESDLAIEVGTVLKIDGWPPGRDYQKLEPSSWDKAKFYLPTGYDAGITHLACNVEITGRTIQYGLFANCGKAIRVKITLVGDGGPDEVIRGYMWVGSHDKHRTHMR